MNFALFDFYHLARQKLTCDQAYFSLERAINVRLMQFLNESSAGSPESGLRLVTELS